MGVIEFKKTKKDDNYTDVEKYFTNFIEKLKSPELKLTKLTELEKFIESSGRELLRRLLQSNIKSRGLGPSNELITGIDKIVRNHKRVSSRHIRSIFGIVEIERLGYGNRGVNSVYPMDSQLNLPDVLYSHSLQKKIVREVIKNSYDNAVEAIEENIGQKIPKHQVEKITINAASDFDDFYKQKTINNEIQDQNIEPFIILTTDGKGVVMLTVDLREATRKKAQSKEHKLDKRLSPGEKKNGKRMATVASVYNIMPYMRSVDDFRKELDSVKILNNKSNKKPKPLSKRVWASLEKDAAIIIEEMFEEGLRRDPKKEKTWIVLVDGSNHQLDLIKNTAKKNKINIVIICDIIHVIEYLWKAARVLCNDEKQCTETWVNERLINILEGKSSLVAAGIRRSATNRKIQGDLRKVIDKSSNYLLNKTPYLKYNEYLKKGYPIATGVIEGACRHLVKDRMDITGARWRLLSAEAVLRLRSLKTSNDFNEYWEFHEKQELVRNHVSKTIS